MNKKALIVTDFQNDFVSSDGKVAKRVGSDSLKPIQNLIPKIQELIDKWREDEGHVIFLISDYNSKNYEGAFKDFREHSPYGNTALKDTVGHELYGIASEKGDKFVVKSFFDGFYETDLDGYLKVNGVEDVYLCGINADVCIFHTATSAMCRGYNVHVFKDATEATTPQNKSIFLNHLKEIVGVKITKSG